MQSTFAFMLFVGAAANAQIRTEVSVSLGHAKAGQKIVANMPTADGRFFYSNVLDEVANNAGTVTFTHKLNRPAFVTLFMPKPVRVFLRPGVKVVAVSEKEVVRYKGELVPENDFLQSLDRNGIAAAIREEFQPTAMRLLSRKADTTAFVSTLDSLLAEETEKVLQFVKANPKSGDFEKYILADAHLFYLDIAFRSVCNRMSDYIFDPVAANPTIIESEWGRLLTRLANQIHAFPSDIYSRSSEYYFNCLYNEVLVYRVWFLKENSVVAEKESLERFQTDWFSRGVPTVLQKLGKENREFLTANFLSYYCNDTQFWCAQQVAMFNRFKDEFDNSSYLTVLELKMLEVERFISPVAKPKKGVVFLEDSLPINTFDELKARFRGKVVYVDIWATWCKPCIEEVKNYGALQRLAKHEPGFSILYLSRDRPFSWERWRGFVSKHRMEGHHVMPNQRLEQELREKIAWSEIPRYFIIGKDGEIVVSDAPPPSDPKTVSLLRGLLK